MTEQNECSHRYSTVEALTDTEAKIYPYGSKTRCNDCGEVRLPPLPESEASQDS